MTLPKFVATIRQRLWTGRSSGCNVPALPPRREASGPPPWARRGRRAPLPEPDTRFGHEAPDPTSAPRTAFRARRFRFRWNRRGGGGVAETTATLATVPSAPQNLAATPGDGEVVLAWQAPGDSGGAAVTGFQYRYAEGASVPAAKAWTSAGTDLTVTVGSLTNGIAHAFEVRAVNAKGEGPAAEIEATPAAVPSAPQNLTAKSGDREVTLAWQAPGDDGGSAVTGYRYRYAEGASVPATTTWQSAGTSPTVTVDSLTNGIAHAFEVRAVNASGSGAVAEIAATPAAVSSAPQNLAATPGDRMVMLVWQAPDEHGGISVTGYQYRYAEGASVPAAKAWRSAGTDLTVTVGNLTNGIAHAFEVRAMSHRTGGDAAEVAATPATVPSAPQNLAATPGDGEVVLAWQAPGDNGGAAVTGYGYRYAEGASVPEATAWTSVGTDLTVTVGSLTNGTAHAFEVRAVNDMGTGAVAQIAATPADDGAGTNTDPTVANTIPDRTATARRAFSYAFWADTFNDADGDTLTYTATRRNGRALPAWLTFTPSTRTASGSRRGSSRLPTSAGCSPSGMDFPGGLWPAPPKERSTPSMYRTIGNAVGTARRTAVEDEAAADRPAADRMPPPNRLPGAVKRAGKWGCASLWKPKSRCRALPVTGRSMNGWHRHDASREGPQELDSGRRCC